MRELIFAQMSQEWLAAYQAGIFTEFMEQRAPGHTVLDDKIYRKGMLDFITEIDDNLARLDLQGDPQVSEKAEELQAMRICALAIIRFAERHAEKALELARQETDPIRRLELEKIAQVCFRVPVHPPHTFWEALQAYWFVHLGVTSELNTWDAFNPGRLDQKLSAAQGLNQAIQQQLAKMPSPNVFTTGDGLNTAGLLFETPEEEKQYDTTIRIDYALSNRHYFFGRVSWGQQDTYCDSANGGLARYPGGGCIVNTYRSPVNYAVSWRWNPAGNVVNEFVFGQNHFFFDFQIPTSDPRTYTYLSTPVTMPDTYDFGNKRTLNTWQFVDNLTWITGPHSLKSGMNVRLQSHRDTRGTIGSYNPSPYLDFSTGINSVDLTTFKIPTDINTTFYRGPLLSSVNFLLGRVGGLYQSFVSDSSGGAYLPGGSLFDFTANYNELDFFAQDTWRLGRKLTLDLGFRWELKMSPTNPDDLIRVPDQLVRVGAPGSSTLRWVNGSLYDDDVNNFGPSVGMAWDPSGDGRSVIRGNYRLAYDRINTFVFSSAIFQSIPGITASIANTDYGTAGVRLTGTLPSLQPTITPNNFIQPPATGSASMRVVDPDFQSPMTHGWAISYQRELFNQATIFEAAYVGRRAEHLFGAYNVNQAELVSNGFLEAFNVVKGLDREGIHRRMDDVFSPCGRMGPSSCHNRHPLKGGHLPAIPPGWSSLGRCDHG